MSALGLEFSLVLAPPGNAYGLQQTPPFVQHDQMVNVAQSPGYSATGIRVIKEAGIMCLAPESVPTDLATGMFTFPSGSQAWTTSQDAGTQKQFLLMPDGSANTTFEALSTAALGANPSFYFTIGTGTPTSGATLDGANSYRCLEVGAGATVPGDPTDLSTGTPFRLLFEYGFPPVLQQATVVDGAWVYSTDFGSSSVVASNTQVKSQDIFNSQNRAVTGDWMSLPDQNMVIVSLYGFDPLIFRGSQQLGYPLQVADGQLHFYGANAVASLGFFPMRYATSGTFTSSDVQIPFVYPGNGFLRYYGASQPAGTTLDGVINADDAGSSVTYTLTLSSEADATGLAPTTPYIREATLYIPPTVYYGQVSGGFTDLTDRISSIVEDSWFDSETLTIRRQVGIDLVNDDDFFAGGGDGIHYAASYSRYLTTDDGSGPVVYSAPVQFITGWCCHKTRTMRKDPDRIFSLVIEDGLYPLESVQVGNAGVFDGCCALRTIGFLAELSGRTDEFIDPLLTMCDFGPDPANCPHMKLPIGTGDSPKMAFHPEDTYLSCMLQVNEYLFGVLFADEKNVLRVIPYYPNVYTAPFLGTFTDSGDGDGDPSDPAFLSQMWDGFTLNIDTADRRTGVFFGGIDPATNTVQGTWLNIDDVPGMEGYVELYNGFRNPLIVISDRFVDPVFTAAYAANALQRIWLPTVTDEHSAAFLPGMSPLLRYNIVEGGNVLSDGLLALSCERVTSTWSLRDPGAFRSRITGRSIYNL